MHAVDLFSAGVGFHLAVLFKHHTSRQRQSVCLCVMISISSLLQYPLDDLYVAMRYETVLCVVCCASLCGSYTSSLTSGRLIITWIHIWSPHISSQFTPSRRPTEYRVQ